MIIYNFLNVSPFDYTAFGVIKNIERSYTGLTTPSLSKRIFGGAFILRCFLDFSVGVGAFLIGLSQISSFFSSERLRQATSKYAVKVSSHQVSLLILMFLCKIMLKHKLIGRVLFFVVNRMITKFANQ